jgi:hypothetical protein
MASAIVAMRKVNKGLAFQDSADEENILDNLTMKLPPEETWDAEFSLGALVLE